VIISALPDYPSASFAQSLRQIIRQITHSFDLPLNKTMWIEHYPPSNSIYIDCYYHLLVARHRVTCHKIDRYQIKSILEQAI
jgi:hypothetical protein